MAATDVKPVILDAPHVTIIIKNCEVMFEKIHTKIDAEEEAGNKDYDWRTDDELKPMYEKLTKLHEQFQYNDPDGFNEKIKKEIEDEAGTDKWLRSEKTKRTAREKLWGDLKFYCLLDDATIAAALNIDWTRWRAGIKEIGKPYWGLSPDTLIAVNTELKKMGKATVGKAHGKAHAHQSLYGDLFDNYDYAPISRWNGNDDYARVGHPIRPHSQENGIPTDDMALGAIGLFVIMCILFACCIVVWCSFLYVFKQTNDKKEYSRSAEHAYDQV
eukprot:235162_1